MPRPKGWRDRREDRSFGETPIGAIIDGVLRRPEFARGLPIGELVSGWQQIVGERLAAESAPLSLDKGVLVVAVTSGIWGAQVRFMLDEIRLRANKALGRDLVALVQVAIRPDAVKPLRRNG